MAYENYRFVAWANATPITGERLGQMSTNIEQVREANDDKPQGLIRITTINLATGNIANNNIVTMASITGSNAVSISPNRYYKVTVTFPGVALGVQGFENSVYTISICNTASASNVSEIASWDFTPHTYTYFPLQTSGIGAEAIKPSGDGHRTVIGAGTYSFVTTSGVAGVVNQSFSVGIKRVIGSVSNGANISSYKINSTTTSPVQFYVEDIGGAITA